jgi:hypothetical protein
MIHFFPDTYEFARDNKDLIIMWRSASGVQYWISQYDEFHVANNMLYLVKYGTKSFGDGINICEATTWDFVETIFWKEPAA